ncbi:hypothetical protein SXCC_00643 [Gluconacetobacter sp. SXCC-1]|nr:hypothetical protein SXCC_00643 [Gluconacetobacter sp. SXCC-1]
MILSSKRFYHFAKLDIAVRRNERGNRASHNNRVIYDPYVNALDY